MDKDIKGIYECVFFHGNFNDCCIQNDVANLLIKAYFHYSEEYVFEGSFQYGLNKKFGKKK